MYANISNMIGREKQAEEMKEKKKAKTERLKKNIVEFEIRNIVIITIIILILNIISSTIIYNT